jgi:hypothetical protein
MNVSDQFQEIGILLTQNGFVTILEEMAISAVPPVKGNGISGQKPPHKCSQGNLTGLQQQVEVTGENAPGQTAGLGFHQEDSEPIKKIVAVGIIPKDLSPFNSAGHDVMQSPWGVNA